LREYIFLRAAAFDSWAKAWARCWSVFDIVFSLIRVQS
jgi:hypothetical protein